MGRRQAERARHGWHQPPRQGFQRGEIRLHRRAERRQRGGPLVGALVEIAGAHVGVVRPGLVADVEAFLQGGRRAGLQPLRLHRLVAVVAAGPVQRDRHAVGQGQRKQPAHLVPRGVQEGVAHAVVGQIEKAGALAGGGEPADGAGMLQAAGVDDRQLHLTPPAALAGSCASCRG